MCNNENNSTLTLLLCTFNISEQLESVCYQDCVIRHYDADIMLPSYMLRAVVTLGTKHSGMFYGEDVRVDPLLLFQRLITVAQTSTELESAFKHELCSYPPAMFDSSLLLREAHKPALADAISHLIGPDVPADVPDDGSRCRGWWGTY